MISFIARITGIQFMAIILVPTLALILGYQMKLFGVAQKLAKEVWSAEELTTERELPDWALGPVSPEPEFMGLGESLSSRTMKHPQGGYSRLFKDVDDLAREIWGVERHKFHLLARYGAYFFTAWEFYSRGFWGGLAIGGAIFFLWVFGGPVFTMVIPKKHFWNSLIRNIEKSTSSWSNKWQSKELESTLNKEFESTQKLQNKELESTLKNEFFAVKFPYIDPGLTIAEKVRLNPMLSSPVRGMCRKFIAAHLMKNYANINIKIPPVDEGVALIMRDWITDWTLKQLTMGMKGESWYKEMKEKERKGVYYS